MKLTSVKFAETVRFENQEQSFLQEDSNKCSLILDEASGVLCIKSTRDLVFTSLSNCVWFKAKEDAPKPEKK